MQVFSVSSVVMVSKVRKNVQSYQTVQLQYVQLAVCQSYLNKAAWNSPSWVGSIWKRILTVWGIDAFELRCWRRLLRVPWTARRSNQSILKEISPEYSLERLMLKLKLQYFGHLMRRVDSFEKTLMLGKIKGRRRRGRRGWDGWMASPTQWTWVWVNSGSWAREAWHAAIHGVAKSRTRLSDWTELY